MTEKLSKKEIEETFKKLNKFGLEDDMAELEKDMKFLDKEEKADDCDINEFLSNNTDWEEV